MLNSDHMRGAVAKVLLLVIAGVSLVGALVFFFYCPCERVPGGYLLGNVVKTPVEDWQFANDARLCQLQVQGALPHSINLNCMSSDGQLYVSCSRCEGKYWSGVALDTPDGRIRVDDNVYPVQMIRVEESAELDFAWRARAAKVGQKSTPRPDHWWSFRIESR